MIFTELFETKTSALTEGVRVIDQDYDLDQVILTMDINGRRVSFTYTDYDEDFDNAERGDVHDQLQRNDWYAALSHPDRMEILDAAYRAIRGEEPGEYRPTVDDEPMDVVDRLDEVTQGVEHSEWADNVKDAYHPAGIRIIKKRSEDGRHVKSHAMMGDKLVGQYNMNTGVGTFTAPKKQGIAEDRDLEEQRYEFQRIKFRGTDHDIGEERYRFVIDGDTIFFNFPSDEDRPDPDSPSFEEILAKVQRSGEVRHYRITPAEQQAIAKKIAAERQRYLDQRQQDMAEAMKPSDIPPSRRDRLTMRDIERERPQGAYRFRVVTPQGDQIDFMDKAAAEQRARAMGGRVEPIDPQPRGLPGRNRFRVQDPQGSRPAATFQDRKSAERYASAKRLPVEIIPEADNKPGARIERILKMLRARHPQAENDLEALIFDFRSQQSQDRSDIARLDAENDAEEADIQRLEKMLDLIRRRRGAAAAEPVQEDDIDDAMRDYLARGGRIQQEPARMPRLGTRLRQHGSRHIGQGREGRAGQLSGRGANTNPGGNKPVVATESLRDGEYHVATVTLDDGTTKKVRITSDQGFREGIKRHFEKQGRKVQDIDVDYAVRSELDEAKKKPQPTNPELWSRAKAAAKSKFDVYPSAYANAFAAKWYKSKGGGWRMGKPKKD